MGNVIAMNRNILCDTCNRKKPQTNKYVNQQARRQLLDDVGDAATVLYMHYYDKASYVNYDVTADVKTAKELGWKLRKVQDQRRKLMNTGWVHVITFMSTEYGKYYLTLLGKETVAKYTEMYKTDPVALMQDVL